MPGRYFRSQASQSRGLGALTHRLRLPEMAERRCQSTVGSVRARLHRALRDPQSRRYLLVRESLEVLRSNDFPLIVREQRNRPSYLPYVAGVLDGERRRDQRWVIRRNEVERPSGATRLAAVNVERYTLGDRGQPRPELAGGIDGSRRPPRLQERLLRRLLG